MLQLAQSTIARMSSYCFRSSRCPTLNSQVQACAFKARDCVVVPKAKHFNFRDVAAQDAVDFYFNQKGMKQVAPFSSAVRVALSARVFFFFGIFGRRIMGLDAFVVAVSQLLAKGRRHCHPVVLSGRRSRHFCLRIYSGIVDYGVIFASIQGELHRRCSQERFSHLHSNYTNIVACYSHIQGGRFQLVLKTQWPSGRRKRTLSGFKLLPIHVLQCKCRHCDPLLYACILHVYTLRQKFRLRSFFRIKSCLLEI